MRATFRAAGAILARPLPIRPLAILLALPVAATRARAQHVGYDPVITLGSDAADRLRLASLRNPAVNFPLLRSASVFTNRPDSLAGWKLNASLPEARAVYNSKLPYSLNDGPLWAGRGWNTAVTPAFWARAPHINIIIAPTFTSSQNLDFQAIPFRQDIPNPRNQWANPFHPLPESIDLPIRFGDQPLRRVDPGQSSITLSGGPVSAGFATENLWWGPGIRNAITLSNNAGGFPHAFLRTTSPVRSRFGTFDAQWIVGRLSESDFFDSDHSNDDRTIAGLAATWATPFDTNFTLGLSRLVLSTRGGSFPVGSAFDVFRSAGHLNADTLAAVPSTARDQITALFGRWVFPSAGFEGYFEWARFEEPLSFRDFLESPGHSEGYTIGLQWSHPVFTRKTFQLQGEASYLEPDPSLRLRRTAVSYTSRGVPQGFTQRGQMLGASIGPGSSSQWVAGDVFANRWRAGAYLGRIRWDNGTFEEPIVPQFKRQDVTLLGGLRGGVTYRGVDLLVDFTHAARFNYLFQTYIVGVFEQTNGIDLLNNTLSFTLSTYPGRW